MQASLGTTAQCLFSSYHPVKTPALKQPGNHGTAAAGSWDSSSAIKQQTEPNLIMNPLAIPPFSLSPGSELAIKVSQVQKSTQLQPGSAKKKQSLGRGCE